MQNTIWHAEAGTQEREAGGGGGKGGEKGKVTGVHILMWGH